MRDSFCCRGLFEAHKLVYSFMLCADIMRQEEKIGQTEWNFFLRGAAGMDKVSKKQELSEINEHTTETLSI